MAWRGSERHEGAGGGGTAPGGRGGGLPRVPGLRFANLLAVRPAAAGAPLLLLGAHWDSQMHSDNDAPANRSRPDPGANDGASGVGVLLQLMRAVDAAGPLPFSVGVLFVDG